MRVYYDEDGKMIGCNNIGHVPEGTKGFTNELPCVTGMRWDFINGGWRKASKELETEALPEMGEGLPRVGGLAGE